MRKKIYGSYKVDKCPFCGKQATASNSQEVPVCLEHKNREILNFKCVCGDWLDILHGKYGPFFNCMNCGNISFSRGIELNTGNIDNDRKFKSQANKSFGNKEFVNATVKPQPKPMDDNDDFSFIRPEEKKKDGGEREEIVVTSDEVDFLY